MVIQHIASPHVTKNHANFRHSSPLLSFLRYAASFPPNQCSSHMNPPAGSFTAPVSYVLPSVRLTKSSCSRIQASCGSAAKMKSAVPKTEQRLRKRRPFPERQSSEKVHKEIKDRCENPGFPLFLLLIFRKFLVRERPGIFLFGLFVILFHDTLFLHCTACSRDPAHLKKEQEDAVPRESASSLRHGPETAGVPVSPSAG